MDDGMSDLYLPLFMMSYENAEAFSDYINKVRMDAQISKSILDFRTICYFAPQLEGNELRLALSGKASGYVKDFQIEGIKASSSSGGFSGTISGKMTGLPDIEKTTMDMKVSNFHLTADGLGKFISEWMTEGELDLHKFAKGSIFMIEAKANGLLNHLHVDADVNSMTGRLNANTTLHNLTDIHKPIEINGQINTGPGSGLNTGNKNHTPDHAQNRIDGQIWNRPHRGRNRLAHHRQTAAERLQLFGHRSYRRALKRHFQWPDHLQ